MLPKIEVTIGGILTEVFTMGELTRTKIGAINVVVEKIVEQGVELTIHVSNDADSGVEEDGYNLVDEVFDTSINDSQSQERAKSDWLDDVSIVLTTTLAEAISTKDMAYFGGE